MKSFLGVKSIVYCWFRQFCDSRNVRRDKNRQATRTDEEEEEAEEWDEDDQDTNCCCCYEYDHDCLLRRR